MSNITLLKNIWEAVYDPAKEVSSVITHYFHPKYTQCINGVEMVFDDYVSHVIEQKKSIKITSIDYKHIVEDGSDIFALYYPRGTNNDGLTIEAEVVAYFQFKEQKLKRIHGQVRLIEGNFYDVDM